MRVYAMLHAPTYHNAFNSDEPWAVRESNNDSNGNACARVANIYKDLDSERVKKIERERGRERE